MYEWTPELETGVETIDAQHREMFRTFNTLLREPGGEEKDLIGEIPWMIGFLEDYVESHLGMEELYMRRYSYPEYPEHKREHNRFIGVFYDLRDEVESKGVNAETAGRIATTLGDWLVGHIMTMDKALGKFLRERNRKKP